jgi:hypothetical protein
MKYIQIKLEIIYNHTSNIFKMFENPTSSPYNILEHFRILIIVSGLYFHFEEKYDVSIFFSATSFVVGQANLYIMIFTFQKIKPFTLVYHHIVNISTHLLLIQLISDYQNNIILISLWLYSVLDLIYNTFYVLHVHKIIKYGRINKYPKNKLRIFELIAYNYHITIPFLIYSVIYDIISIPDDIIVSLSIIDNIFQFLITLSYSCFSIEKLSNKKKFN